jgi:hypothetical protein
MASELIRQTWCDIHLKQENIQVPGIEGYVVVRVLDDEIKQLDPCQEHIDKGITLADIIEYGFTPASTTVFQRRRMGRKPDAPGTGVRRDPSGKVVPKPGRTVIECPICHRQFESRTTSEKAMAEGRWGSGWALHKTMHTDRGEPIGDPIRV